MIRVHKGLILFVLLAIAIAFYSVGFARGAVFLVIAGMLFELGFWVGLFKSYPKDASKENH